MRTKCAIDLIITLVLQSTTIVYDDNYDDKSDDEKAKLYTLCDQKQKKKKF